MTRYKAGDCVGPYEIVEVVGGCTETVYIVRKNGGRRVVRLESELREENEK